MIVKQLIGVLLKQGVSDEFGKNIEINPAVGYPKKEEWGNYSSPVCFDLAKKLKENPQLLAEKLIKRIIENDKEEMFENIEFVKPGFLNFFLSKNYLYKVLDSIEIEKENYGKSECENPEKIIIEFVSANPTGPLNVVSARAAVSGDVIASLLEMTGNKVYREYYVNDAGNQVHLLGKSIIERIKEIKGDDFQMPEGGYHGEYIKDIAKTLIEEKWDEYTNIKDEDKKIEFASDFAINRHVNSHKKNLEDFGVNFDNWFSESSLYPDSITSCFDIINEKGYVFEDEGKKWFKSTQFGDEKDRVVFRDNGLPAYFLADGAYHLDKIKRGFDRIIDIWGPDHHGYIARMKGMIEALGFEPEKFTVLIVQQVNLLEKGVKLDMSKRKGQLILMQELVDKVGVDVARFFFLMRSISSHLDFDLDLALKHSDENPVFYIQYSYARICSIFREAEKQNFLPDSLEKFSFNKLGTKEELMLINKLIQYPEIIQEAASEYAPHKIADYLLKLANLFHRFYTENRVLGVEKELTESRLALINCMKIVLKNGLDLIGISSPDRM